MKSFYKFLAAVVALAVAAMCGITACSTPAVVYNGEYLERRLALPYSIEGTLTKSGERFDILLDVDNYTNDAEKCRFKLEFLSGDVTEGITVEFFETGVFIFFDDLRFKTNSEMFTELETLKVAFDKFAEPHTEKEILSIEPVNGIELTQIGLKDDTNGITAYLNKTDGSIVRVNAGADITLDIKKFTVTSEPITKNPTEETNEVFDVVDDYIEGVGD